MPPIVGSAGAASAKGFGWTSLSLGGGYWILAEPYSTSTSGANRFWTNGFSLAYNATDKYLFVPGIARFGNVYTGVMRVKTDGTCTIQETSYSDYNDSFAYFGLSVIPNTSVIVENGQSIFFAKEFGQTDNITPKIYYSSGNSRAIKANSDGIWALALHNTDIGKQTWRQPYVFWNTFSAPYTITSVLGRNVGGGAGTYDWTGNNYFATSDNSKSFYAILTRNDNYLQQFIRMNTSGTVLWQKGLGQSSSYSGTGIAVGDVSESIYMMYCPGDGVSFRIQKFDTNGTSIWCRSINSGISLPVQKTEYCSNTVAITPDGTKVLFNPQNSGYVVCVDASNGNFLWARSLYTQSYTQVYSAIIATNTEFYWVRGATGDYDGLIMKLDINNPQTGSWSIAGSTVYSTSQAGSSSAIADTTSTYGIFQNTINPTNAFSVTQTYNAVAGGYSKVSL